MPSNMLRKATIVIFILTGLAAVASAEVKLAGVFGDHMVLQRDVALPVWGWANPGEAVTVTLGGKTKTAVADASGKWSIRFDALRAGGPLQLHATGAKNAVALSDVLVGEVWLCSGQSNMVMEVKGAANKDAEIAAAQHPQIRMYFIDHVPAKEPQARRNGHWVVCSPQSVGEFSAAAYFFGRELHKQLNVPVGLIDSAWGGSPIQAWTSIKSHEAVPELKPMVAALRQQEEMYASGKPTAEYEKQLAHWEKAAAAAKASGKQFKDPKPQPPQEPAIFPWSPASLYNGMIAPLVPYAIRGAIWYQGEANAGSTIYGIYLKTMIANWRDDWKQGDFPFLFVQLPNFTARQVQPSEPVGGWALEREQFLKTLDAVKNTGMAVTIDIGEANNIHPHDKQDVGKRLAQWALAKVYGKAGVVASGPLYKSSRQTPGKIVVEFNYVGGKLAARDGGKLTGFAIAGADKKFFWADAQIVGDAVVVSSPAVPSPVAVRYAWAMNPPCNLVNKAGLPASPFRTDDWQ